MNITITEDEATLLYCSMRAAAAMALQGVPNGEAYMRYDMLAHKIYRAREEHRRRCAPCGIQAERDDGALRPMRVSER